MYSVVTSFSNFIQDCAKLSAKFVMKTPLTSRRRNRTPWFSGSCTNFRNSVKQYEKLVNQYPFNSQYRKHIDQNTYDFANVPKSYTQLITAQYRTLRHFGKKTACDNPKTFWKKKRHVITFSPRYANFATHTRIVTLLFQVCNSHQIKQRTSSTAFKVIS